MRRVTILIKTAKRCVKRGHKKNLHLNYIEKLEELQEEL